MGKNQETVLDIHEKPGFTKWVSLSIQHLFAMFGSTVLVPMLVGLSPAVALASSGLGTLAYILITRGQVPAYLGSSFAFIAPLITAKAAGGPGAAMMGTFLAGIAYGIVALIIAKAGYKWLMKLLPPVVVGPVIIVIGLGVAGTACSMAMYKNYGAAAQDLIYSPKHIAIALCTLAITIVSSAFLKGFFRIIPVLIGIVGGYIISIFAGIVDFTPVIRAHWFALPDLVFPFASYKPTFSWSIFFLMVPVAIVTLSEHIGHQLVLSKVVGKDLVAKPGLGPSILGDGVSIVIASLIGAPPTTTYGENIGVLAITKAYSVYVIGGAAVFAICFSFIGKISALLSTIPTCVMGGVSILLFGIIASSGLRMLVDNKVDFSLNRNLIISSVILVIGVGGAYLKLTKDIQLSSMALAAIIGVILNLILPGRPKEDMNMFEEEPV
ncbi:uracil permease [Heyndrickxia shackletonii]|uniref:Uracil permease n=1 Tax=Heyndrickxia shackletonii TaxID=157838 RepID=A0A0Q3WYF0_9BACI|nr:solute carrier family 23 protein [Heyndrickxia shackletonii]KQL54698.1 uracil permease [Heyndrickxia shackletonii]NEY98349.1 uracil permease [Heyndrickxia shackletonii]